MDLRTLCAVIRGLKWLTHFSMMPLKHNMGNFSMKHSKLEDTFQSSPSIECCPYDKVENSWIFSTKNHGDLAIGTLETVSTHFSCYAHLALFIYSCGAGACFFGSCCQGLYPYQSAQRKPQTRGDYIVAWPLNTNITQLHQSSGVGPWWLFNSGLMGTVDILQARSTQPRNQPTFPVADHDTLLKLSFKSDYSKTCP